MTLRLQHVLNATMSLGCTAWADDEMTVPRDLTNVVITCRMTAPMQPDWLLTPVKIAPLSGDFTLDASVAAQENLRPGVFTGRIFYREGTVTDCTEAFQIEVVEDYNLAD